MTSSSRLTTFNPLDPATFSGEEEVFANSRDVAAVYGKRNADVNRAIRDLIRHLPRDVQLDFTPNKIKDLTGVTVADYDLTRRGFMLLVMGFTGTKALKWKIKFVEAFNRMREEIERRATMPEFNDPAAAAEAWAEDYKRRQAVAGRAEQALAWAKQIAREEENGDPPNFAPNEIKELRLD